MSIVTQQSIHSRNHTDEFGYSYSKEQMDAVAIAHRNTKTWSDYVALFMVRSLRWGLDLATGYRHDQAVALGQKDASAAETKTRMTPRKWITR